MTFLAAGWLFLPLLGFETDELLFAQGIVAPETGAASVSIANHRFSVMIGSYIGGVKSLLFAPLMRAAGYTLFSVRVPVLLLCALTLSLVGRLMWRISGPRAASFVVWMLGTDVTFLTTGVFDWGTVVLQNLFLVSGLVFFEAWSRTRREWLLFAVGLAFGLALWDKAIFIWNGFGMIFALLVLWCLSLIRVHLRIRAAAAFALGMVIGGLPLVYYNFSHKFTTASQNSHFAFKEVPKKFDYLLWTINGETAAVFFADFSYPAPHPIERPLAKVSRRLEKPGLRTFSSWRLWLLVLITPIGVFAASREQRNWILFCVLSAAGAWFLSAVTINAGQSAHHTVLIWPFLYVAMAVAADASASKLGRFRTPALLLLLAVFTLRGLAQITYAYSNLTAFSPMIFWTNAEEPLATYLQATGVKRVVNADWAYDNQILIRSQGRISAVRRGSELFGNAPVGADLTGCKSPNCVLISHVKERQVYPDVDHWLDTVLAESGVHKHLLSRISDAYGTPTFEVFALRE